MPALFNKCFVLLALALMPLQLFADGNLFLERHINQRQVFLELSKLLQEGDVKEVSARRADLKGYPLADYLDYLLLKNEIQRHPRPVDLLERVNRMRHDKRNHRRLISALKNRSAKLLRWQDYKQVSAGEDVPVHPCDDLLSGFKNGQALKFTQTMADLWADIGRHTRSCNDAFAQLLAAVPDVPTGALWRRTVNLIKRGDLKDAAALLKYFSRSDKLIVKAWIDGADEPQDLLQRKVIRGDSVHHREIANFLMRRWAREDLPAASDFWRSGAKHFGYNEKSTQQKLSEYAVLAAKRGLPETEGMLHRAKATRDVRFWRIRTALQAMDWKRCITAIDGLSATEKLQSRWQYWQARCLAEQGYSAAATRIYNTIASGFDYYGFLAADRLSKDYQINAKQPAAVDAELQVLYNSPEIERAIEYFLVALPWEGRREWNRALKSSSKSKYLAAARVAQSLGWHDRAIFAAVAAGETEALDLLYPVSHRDYVKQVANLFNVEPELIYAVVRRESRFMPDVKSPAGAVGLMQLMPGTAAQMGKALGIKAPRWKLIEGELNIKLGTRYLSHVLGRFDNNIVLATAAYNAGPSRVKRWITDKAMPADLWVETIPFDETRDYVKAVLFNTVVSEWILNDGAVTRLQHRMVDLAPLQ